MPTRNAAHVAACDEAVHIGGPRPQESYLRGDVILEAARRTGAQAIHPGYGFLSENAEFAAACARAGIAFVGPVARGHRRHGFEVRRQGAHGEGRSAADAGLPRRAPGAGLSIAGSGAHRLSRCSSRRSPVAAARACGASTAAADFAAALASCQREAAASFKDDRVLIEKYLDQCAAHRSPGVRRQPRQRGLSVRARLLGAAPASEGDRRGAGAGHDAGAPPRRWARRRSPPRAPSNYSGAGTVEFIVDGRRVLLHGNEHAAAGRASGHRDDHRARSRGVAAAGRRRASRCRWSRTSSRSTGTPSRRGCTPKIRRATSCRRSAG